HGVEGRVIDPKRLLAEQMLPRSQDVNVELPMQVMWHRAIHGLHLRDRQQLMIIGERSYARQGGGEPGHRRRAHVAHGDDVWLHILIEQATPACRCTGKLAAHQATANDAKVERPHAGWPSCSSADACAGVAFSCTMAISACVMPRGLRCWMTLRP